MGQDKGGDKGQPTDAPTPVQRFAALLETEDNPPQEVKKESSTTQNADEDDDLEVVEEDVEAEEEDEEIEGDDAEGEEDEPEGEGDDELVFEVIINGEKKEVPATEVAAGYQRQEDYSRKTAALAEERKAFHAERESVQQERARYAQLLEKLEARLKDEGPQERSQEEWQKLRQDDPAEYAAQRADWLAHREKLDRVASEKVEAQRKLNEEQGKKLQEYVESERQKLFDAVPEWKDQAKFAEDTRSLATYAVQSGFTPEELDAVVDHRAVVLLRKAMLYDQLQGKKTVVRKKAKSAPTIKPGTTKRSKPSKSKNTQRAREQLRETGSVRDAADAFLTMLEG